MRNIIIILVLMLAVPSISFGAPDGRKGASDKAYEHASDQSIFNRTGDWFATIGKSEEEKATIKAERVAERKAKRLEKGKKEKKEKAGKMKQEKRGEAEKVKKEKMKKAEKIKKEKMEKAEKMKKEKKKKADREMKKVRERKMDGSGGGKMKSGGMGGRGKNK